MRRWIETDDPGLIPTADPSAQMATLLSAAMAFVAAIILATALTAARTAATWEASVTAGMTVELPTETDEDRQEAVITALADLPGVASARVLSPDEMRALLAPWLGETAETEALRLPVLIDIVGEVEFGAVAETVGAVSPQAIVTDHAAWRDPVLRAAGRIRAVSLAALFMAALTAGGVVWLAVTASVARGGRTVEVLRLVGATDAFVISRFARPFAVRAGIGATIGTVAAILALVLVRLSGTIGQVPAGPVGYEWLWIILIPLLVGSLAWIAARLAVSRALGTFG